MMSILSLAAVATVEYILVETRACSQSRIQNYWRTASKEVCVGISSQQSTNDQYTPGPRTPGAHWQPVLATQRDSSSVTTSLSSCSVTTSLSSCSTPCFVTLVQHWLVDTRADPLAYRRLYSPRTRGPISYIRDFISLSARGMFHSYDYEGVDNDI